MRVSPIPVDFIRAQVSLSWRAALWGYERQLVGWTGIVNLAIDRVQIGSIDVFEVELASLTKSDTQRVGELLRILANAAPVEPQERIEKIWLYLVLSWLWSNKERVSDPLGEVESIYADFDYPDDMRGFVRYMPATDEYDPSLHSKHENESRLISLWCQFLKLTELELKKVV